MSRIMSMSAVLLLRLVDDGGHSYGTEPRLP
jgi:hypothetical protein